MALQEIKEKGSKVNMKILMIKGFSKTGKTSIVTALVTELCRRGYSVGTVKDIHFEYFSFKNNEKKNESIINIT